MRTHRPRLAVFKFASCDGCQLALLDCEDALLAIAERVDIVNFPEASRAIERGPYDVALVEGSITTAHDAERIRQVRASAKVLVTLGACATAGGIQALRSAVDVREWVAAVYARPEYVSTLDTSTPIAHHVRVDLELRGCPISKEQLLEALGALLQGRTPRFGTGSLCLECKRRGLTCITVSRGTPCLGPVTQAGCGALCPSFHRGCYGCFGPSDSCNAEGLVRLWTQNGIPAAQVRRALQSFNAAAPAFHAAAATLS